MVITEKTKLKHMSAIHPVLSLTDIDLMKECAKFKQPESIRGVRPLPFYDVSFRNLAWLWDIKKPEEMIVAFAEVFFYSRLSKFRKWMHKDSEAWAKRWLLNCPLIDFYNFANEMTDRIKHAAEEFAKMRVDLTKEEKAAGYGEPDPEGVQKMIDTFAQRQRISSLEEAGNYSWAVYRFVFKVMTDENNKKRKYSKIMEAKTKKR